MPLRAEDYPVKKAWRAAVFETSSVSLIIHVGQSTQAYIHQRIIHPSRPERIPRVGRKSRAEERAILRAQGRVSGGGKSKPRHIHRLYRRSRAEMTPRAEIYLVQREKA